MRDIYHKIGCDWNVCSTNWRKRSQQNTQIKRILAHNATKDAANNETNITILESYNAFWHLCRIGIYIIMVRYAVPNLRIPFDVSSTRSRLLLFVLITKYSHLIRIDQNVTNGGTHCIPRMKFAITIRFMNCPHYCEILSQQVPKCVLCSCVFN